MLRLCLIIVILICLLTQSDVLAAANSSNFLPANGQTGLAANRVTLSWSAGSLAVTGYNVYLGTDQTAVTNGSAGTKVSSLQIQTSFKKLLSQNTTYYWRVEDVTTPLSSSAVMSFTTSAYVDPNLIGWWNFDNIQGSIVVDDSLSGHGGILVDNAAIINDEQRGKVLALDGDGDYVDLGNGAWTNPGNNMTITAWIKVDIFDVVYQTIIAKGSNSYRLGRTNSDNSLKLFMNYTSSNYKSITATANVNDGKWHHVAAVYGNNIIKMYIDFIQQGSDVGMSALYITNDPLMIGRNSSSPGWDWQGWIDDVRLYNRALTIDEIKGPYCLTQLKPLGDITNDCVVDLSDLQLLAANWLSQGTSIDVNVNLAANGSGQEIINYKDFSVLADNWLSEIFLQ